MRGGLLLCPALACLPFFFGGIDASSLYFSGFCFCWNDIMPLLFYVKYDYNIFQKEGLWKKQ